MNKLLNFEEFLNEKQTSLDFGKDEIGEIFDKFLQIVTKTKNTKEGKMYIHEYGSSSLSFIKNGSNIISAMFSEDRSHDYLEYMNKKGFGPNIYQTIKKLGNVSVKGYTTIVTF